MKLRSFVFAALLTLPLASSFAQVGISVNIAPPPLVVEEQPPAPVEGYIWTPGYWAYENDYYWVPGVWIAPPAVGLLWTPPWWGWNNGVYAFNAGYWGPTVGFYGGINYGFGYWGSGYWGGHWQGDHFYYNTAVTHVNNTVIHNTYVDKNVVNKQVNRTHTSFNGPNGVKAKETAEQKAAAEKKLPPTQEQLSHREEASKDQNLHASANHGKPNSEAIKSFNQTHGQGAGAEGAGAAAGAGAGKAENKTGVPGAEHHEVGTGVKGEEHGNKHEAENFHGNKHNEVANEGKVHTKSVEHHGQNAMNQHAMNQQMMQHHQQQMGGQHHPPPMGAYHPQGGGPKGGHPQGQPQQGKKKGEH
jgi:hypothetical protein